MPLSLILAILISLFVSKAAVSGNPFLKANIRAVSPSLFWLSTSAPCSKSRATLASLAYLAAYTKAVDPLIHYYRSTNNFFLHIFLHKGSSRKFLYAENLSDQKLNILSNIRQNNWNLACTRRDIRRTRYPFTPIYNWYNARNQEFKTFISADDLLC